MGNKKIDEAVFYRLGETQTYAGVLFRDGIIVGNLLDCMGAFIPDMENWLKEKYPEIKITMSQ